jgi:hypothetical protein
MANTNAPFGARPVRYLSGAAWNGKCNLYYIPAADGTATFVGDFVKPYGEATAAGIPQVIADTKGSTHTIGVVVGFVPDPTNLSLNYRAASTLRGVYVVDDPNVIFEMQEDSDGAALAVADVGENCDVIATAGDTTTGYSKFVIDSSDHKTATAQVRILRLAQRPNNAVGNYAVWEVLINEHELRNTAGT